MENSIIDLYTTFQHLVGINESITASFKAHDGTVVTGQVGKVKLLEGKRDPALSLIKDNVGVYIIFPGSSDKAYIGSTSMLRRRISMHRGFARRRSHQTIALDGEFSRLEESSNAYVCFFSIDEAGYEDIAYVFEQELITALWDSGILLNRGSNALKPLLGTHPTEETRKKLSLSMHESKRYIQLFTQEARKNLAESRRRFFLEHPEVAISMRGGLNRAAKAVLVNGVKYDTSTEAAEALGVPYNSFRRMLRYPKYTNITFLDGTKPHYEVYVPSRNR